MLIHRLTFSAAELQAIPTSERALLVVLAHALNEVNTFNKLLALCLHFPHEPKCVAHAQSTQALILAKALVGKLNESWVAVQDGYFRTKLALQYDPVLESPARSALAELKSYFGRKSLVNSVRNAFSFHYSLSEAAVTVPPDIPSDEIAIYLHAATGNSLYLFAEVVMNIALFDGIEPANPEAALDRLLSEMSAVVGHLNTFGQGLIVALLAQHIGEERLRSSMDVVDVGVAPNYTDLSIPYFIEMPTGVEPNVA